MNGTSQNKQQTATATVASHEVALAEAEMLGISLHPHSLSEDAAKGAETDQRFSHQVWSTSTKL